MPKLVGPRGPWKARVMCIGEAPGANEERLGQPFVGGAGQLLEGELAAAGLDPSNVFFTNLCQERPPGNEIRRWHTDAGIPNVTIASGLEELQKQIDVVKPNVIIPLGNYPLRYLTGKGRWSKDNGWTGITDYRGSILEGSSFARGIKCIPTYHPAAALREYPLKHIIRLDLQRAASQCGFPEIRRPRKHLVLDPAEPERSLWGAWLTSTAGTLSPTLPWSDTPHVASASFLTADIEYIGDKLLCIGLTRHADVAVTLVVRRSEDIDFIRGILLSGVPLCFQNGMFDGSILEYFHGIACTRYIQHDTMIAMHAAYTEWPKNLGFIASIFTEQPVWWEEIDWKKIKAGLQPIDVVYPYNAIDTWVTHDSMEKMLGDELRDSNVYDTYRHEMALVAPLWSVSKRGTKIDTERLTSLRTTLDEERVTLEAGLYHVNGGVPVNVKSPQQVATLLYDKLGIPKVGPKTPGGAWQMNDATLATLLLAATNGTQRSAIQMVRKTRERRDLISKFCEIELDDDGRMRCHYDPAKTVTGRLSSRKFYPTDRGTNLQNVPRDPRVRAVFVADRGYVFGYADLKSAESLVVAHITGDREMLRLHSPEYLSGELDGHKYVASFLLQKPIGEITKDERYLGKRVRHAGNYGLSWAKLQAMINTDAQETGVSVTAAQAKDLITRYRQFHPGLEDWWRDVLYSLRTTHSITTLLGRKRIFYDRPDSILPEAIAQSPQGTVADTLNIGLLRVSPETYLDKKMKFSERQWIDLAPYEDKCFELMELGYQTLLQVHDAIGFQAPEKNLDRVVYLLTDAMTVPLTVRRKSIAPYEFTIPVDVQVGLNWGEYDPKNPEENPNGLKRYIAA